MQTCPSCGYSVMPDDRYCGRCGAPVVLTPALRCQGCGRTNSSLRVAYFLLVFSVVVMSFKRGVGAGVLCGACRLRRGLVYAGLSLVLGPWGIPHGLIWTVEALVVNLRGGRLPQEANLGLLPALAATLYGLGQVGGAAEALEAALKIRDDPHLRWALAELRQQTGGKEAGTW